MVNVSEKFKALSMDNGREITCKIVAGDEIFWDDRIIEFDFDDVIHPNWYTIGSTCSNRFAFSVRYSGELEVHDEIRPYISFDGEEWCPLGVFYVARRYVRGNYASIICYDRMYSLEMEYVPKISEPTTIKDILNDICVQYGIECDNSVYEYRVENIPIGTTARDMIGYIAGVAQGNAKFDRRGVLKIKSYSSMENFFLEEKNCMDYSRNMSYSLIGRLVVDTGNDIIEAGRGGELSTLEIYNPFITKNRADNMIAVFERMKFYGADIQMQGLPFIESGDHIFLRDENKKYYPLAVSELEFHYDGGFTARLYSRMHTYTDAAVHQDDLSEALNRIRASLGNICLKSVNSEDISLSSIAQNAASFEFQSRISGLFAQADLSFTLDGEGEVEIKAYVNGELVRETVHETKGDKELVHFYFPAENLPKGKNTVLMTLRAVSGEMSIQSGGLVATLVCRGAAGGNEKEMIRDREQFSDKAGRVSLFLAVPFKVKGFKSELILNNEESE